MKDKKILIGTTNTNQHASAIGLLTKYGYSIFDGRPIEGYSKVSALLWPNIIVNLDKKTIEGRLKYYCFNSGEHYWWDSDAASIIEELDKEGHTKFRNIAGVDVEVTKDKVYFDGDTISYAEVKDLYETMTNLKTR